MAGPESVNTYLETRWRRRGCECGGDQYLDLEDGPGWKCLMCSRKVFIKIETKTKGPRPEGGERRT